MSALPGWVTFLATVVADSPELVFGFSHFHIGQMRSAFFILSLGPLGPLSMAIGFSAT